MLHRIRRLGIIRYIQDYTGGIAGYGGNLSTIERGDSVVITGPLAEYFNLFEITPAKELEIMDNQEGKLATIFDYLEKDPHRFLEGALIASLFINASNVYIYMRDEYPDVIKFLREEIKKIEDAFQEVQISQLEQTE